MRRYWVRMGRPLGKAPQWQGEPLKLFSVFSAVNDRGGYEQVRTSASAENSVGENTSQVRTV